MNVLKIVGRVILILLMIPMVFNLALAVIGIVEAANQKAETISYMIGRLVGTLVLLILFILVFKKLGNKNASS